MASQGFWGAVEQYFTVEDKPRLHRRNTYFEDHLKLSDIQSLHLGLIAFSVAITIVMLWLVI